MITDTNSTNPYEASNIDEKPAEIVRFFKGEPVPQKIVGIVLWDAMHYAYSSDKRPHFAIGIMHGLYLALVAAAFFAFIEGQHLFSFWLIGVTIVALFVLWVLLYVISIKAIFRILRKERMVFAPSIREIWQLFHSLINGILFLLTFLGSFLLATIVFVPAVFVLEPIWNTPSSNIPMFILGVCLYGIAIILWIAFVCIFYMRSALAIHCIIDQNVNFLTAYRRAWSLTRGNLRTLAFGTPGTSKPIVTGLIVILTCGLGLLPIIGYYFCWLTVAYLMLSGQCETVAQQPDEW